MQVVHWRVFEFWVRMFERPQWLGRAQFARLFKHDHVGCLEMSQVLVGHQLIVKFVGGQGRDIGRVLFRN